MRKRTYPRRFGALALALCMLLGILPATAPQALAAAPQWIDPATAVAQNLALIEREESAGHKGSKYALPSDYDKNKDFIIDCPNVLWNAANDKPIAGWGHRYSYDGHDIKGKGKEATISVSGNTDGHFRTTDTNDMGVTGLYNMDSRVGATVSGYDVNALGVGLAASAGGTVSGGGNASGSSIFLGLSEVSGVGFRSSNIGYYPFAVSVWVPATTVKQVQFTFDVSAGRLSKGAAGYYVEVID